MLAVPKLSISKKLERSERYDPEKVYEFRYKSKRHPEFPRDFVLSQPDDRSSTTAIFRPPPRASATLA